MLLSVDIPDTLVDPGQSAWFVKNFLEGVARGCLPCWADWGLPLLYESGVSFGLPPNHGTGAELTLLPPVTLQEGVGDCDRLSVWRCAERWFHGRPAAIYVEWRGETMHALVRIAAGGTPQSHPQNFEDPSEILGGFQP